MKKNNKIQRSTSNLEYFKFDNKNDQQQNDNNQSWMVQRDKITLQYLKEENKKLRQNLYSTKIFLNMVIHDLRNPAS